MLPAVDFQVGYYSELWSSHPMMSLKELMQVPCVHLPYSGDALMDAEEGQWPSVSYTKGLSEGSKRGRQTHR